MAGMGGNYYLALVRALEVHETTVLKVAITELRKPPPIVDSFACTLLKYEMLPFVFKTSFAFRATCASLHTVDLTSPCGFH